ncbi:MAG: DMT family transporter [Clostridia bacterium]|nr:DMT family transporter [Clostridia bacterium]
MEQTKQTIFTNKFIVALAALFCCALWGSATPFIKLGYELMLPVRDTASTMLFAGVRFTLAGILVILIYSLARKKFLYPKKENLGRVATVATFQTVVQYIFFYIGLANTSGVKGTVASGSSAFFALLIASLIFRQEKLTFKKILACILGFGGIILINLNGLDFNMNFFGDCFVIFSAIASAASAVLVKKYSKFEDAVIISGYQFVMGGIVMIIVGLIFGGIIAVSGIKAISVLIYLAFLSAAAYSIWGVLLKHNPVSKVTFYSFTTPVFGVLLSKLMLSEESLVSPVNLLITLLLMCAGIMILNYKKE